MKIAAVVVGLFVAGLAYLSQRGWIYVKWTAMENATRSTLANVTTQAIHTFNYTASQFATLLISEPKCKTKLTSNVLSPWVVRKMLLCLPDKYFRECRYNKWKQPLDQKLIEEIQELLLWTLSWQAVLAILLCESRHGNLRTWKRSSDQPRGPYFNDDAAT